MGGGGGCGRGGGGVGFFFQAEDGIRDRLVTGVQTCALPICAGLDTLNIRVGVSSVRVDLIPESLLDLMLKTGLRTMTIAPEAGSERLRKAINKPILSEQILTRSEERRVGKECRSRWSPDQ